MKAPCTFKTAMKPTRRLRKKTTMPTITIPAPAPAATPPDMEPEADKKSTKRKVYLITLPHPVSTHSREGIRLVAPESMSKLQMMECILYAFQHPVFIDPMHVKLAAVDPTTGAPVDTNASMLLRRLRIYNFTRRISQPPANIPYCGRCFATFVYQHANAYSAVHNYPQFS